MIVHALRGVSVDFYPGEYIAIMGAVGLRQEHHAQPAGMPRPPHERRVLPGGRDISGLDDDELSEIRSRYLGFIFQSYNLIQQYTVLENIQLPLTYQGTGEISRRPRALGGSGGARGPGRPSRSPPLAAFRRPAAARGDRPLADQRPVHHPGRRSDGKPDTTTSYEIMEMLERLNDTGKTIIMVTHEDDIAAWAKRVIRMRDGLIIDDSPSPRTEGRHGEP